MKKLLIVLAVLLLAAPTMAAEWNFYGSARFATFSTDVDMDQPGVDSDTDTMWRQQNNSRIGAKVKFNDQIGGRFEYGAKSSINKRHLYGTYNFGVGEVLIGQTYTPLSSLNYSQSVYGDDGNLTGIGQFYVGRRAMIQLTYGDLKLAFVEPKTSSSVLTYNSVTDTLGTWTEDGDTTIPKIEASYGFKGEMFFVDLFGGYQTYEVEEQGGPSFDIDSYVVGIGAGLNMGPAYFKAGFHMGENFGNYDQLNQAANYFGADKFIDRAVIVDGNLEDSDGMGYLAVLGFTANDMLKFQAGYGYEETEIVDYEAEVSQYYLQATIHIHKNFFVVPEIGMIEYEEEGVSAEPELFYVGAKWQINF
jgi:hypothetical protein